MRSRNRLHFNHIEGFKSFLIRRHGFIDIQRKGIDEVLRMSSPLYKEVLLVYRRISARQHYTTFGLSDVMLSEYLAWKRINNGGS